MNSPRNIFSKEQLDQDKARVEASSEFRPLTADAARESYLELSQAGLAGHEIRVQLGKNFDALCSEKTVEGVQTLVLTTSTYPNGLEVPLK